MQTLDREDKEWRESDFNNDDTSTAESDSESSTVQEIVVSFANLIIIDALMCF